MTFEEATLTLEDPNPEVAGSGPDPQLLDDGMDDVAVSEAPFVVSAPVVVADVDDDAIDTDEAAIVATSHPVPDVVQPPEPVRRNAISVGTLITDRYRLDQELPSPHDGAQLWAATDQVLERPVRLTLVTAADPTPVLDAARRAALVGDGRLHRILDVGTAETRDHEPLHYIVNEPLAGRTLVDYVNEAPLSEEHTRAVIGETAQALDAAAKRGLHHLNLRPENIHFDNHRLVVTGLGVDAALTGQNPLAKDNPGAAVADARALSALAYYARSGHWAGEDIDQPLPPNAIEHAAPLRDDNGGVVLLSEVAEDTSPDLVDLTRRALGSDEARHPRSASEVAAELKGWDTTLAALARPGAGPSGATGIIGSAVVGAGAVAGAASGLISSGVTGVSGTAPVAPARTSVRTTRQVQAVRKPVRSIAAITGSETLVDSTVVSAEPRVATAAVPMVAAPNRGIVVPTIQASSLHDAPGVNTTYVTVPTAAPLSTYDLPRKRGINPTPIVLILALAGLLYGGYWAATTLFGFVQDQLHTDTAATADANGAGEAGTVTLPDGTVVDATGEDGAAVPAVDARPVVESIVVLDSTERPENAMLAFDGDPGTAWYTYTYNNATFGDLKPGVAVQIKLEAPAPVSGITLNTRGTGGQVEVHQAQADDPTGGPVIVSGAFSPLTELRFPAPITGDSFILWITQLPEIAPGQYRLEIEEITLQ